MDPSQKESKDPLVKLAGKKSENEKKVREAVAAAVDRTSSAFREWEEDLQQREAELNQKREELEQERETFEKEVQATRATLERDRRRMQADTERAREDFEEERRRMVAEHISVSDIIGLNMGGEKTVQVK